MKSKPMQYTVAWTVEKPTGASSVQLNGGGLADAMTLARDLWIRNAYEERLPMTLRVLTPLGHTFLEWTTAE